MPRPPNIVIWADDATWTSGPRSGQNTKISPPGSTGRQGLVGGEPVRSEYLNYVLNNFAEWIDWISGGAGTSVGENNGLFGDGSDGAVTISAGTTILTRDMFYTDLDIEAGATLHTAGFRVFATGSIGNAGTIHHNGEDGGDGDNFTGGSGGTGGLGISGGSLAAQRSGGDGGDASGTGNPGAAGSTIVASSVGGDGGDGGDNTIPEVGGAGGNSGAIPTAAPRHALAIIDGTCRVAGTTYLIEGGAGGGGGSGGTALDYPGGGGGAGGGPVVIVARRLVNNGVISSNGGDGGAGLGTFGGGGGGGGGGYVGIVTRDTITGTGTIEVDGGAGGGSGGSADDGDAGDPGFSITVIV